MRTGPVLADLYANEHRLVRELLDAAERHKDDHEIHYLAGDLADWSRRHLADLADTAARFDLAPTPPAAPGLPEGPEDPGLLLLHDLRHVHLRAAEVSVGWTVLGQVAKASRDDALLALVQRCHPDTLRQMRWALAHLKVSAAQALLG